jgi:hypothetical protein
MNGRSLQKPAGIFSLVLMAILTLPLIAIAGSGEEANAVIDRWSAAYSSTRGCGEKLSPGCHSSRKL